LAGTPYPYVTGGDARDQPGIPGQGNSNPLGAFENHYIVKYNGKIYDASYGAGPFNTENDHENAAIDGIYSSSMRRTVARKQDPTKQELKYTAK